MSNTCSEIEINASDMDKVTSEDVNDIYFDDLIIKHN